MEDLRERAQVSCCEAGLFLARAGLEVESARVNQDRGAQNRAVALFQEAGWPADIAELHAQNIATGNCTLVI